MHGREVAGQLAATEEPTYNFLNDFPFVFVFFSQCLI